MIMVWHINERGKTQIPWLDSCRGPPYAPRGSTNISPFPPQSFILIHADSE
jgi:hypothetical protein